MNDDDQNDTLDDHFPSDSLDGDTEPNVAETDIDKIADIMVDNVDPVAMGGNDDEVLFSSLEEDDGRGSADDIIDGRLDEGTDE